MNLALRWNQLLNDPFFRDAPYKIELNKTGQILMSPASNWHGYAQGELAAQIRNGKRAGKVITECSVLTRDGIRVADVAWASDAFFKEHGFSTPYKKAPEICIEILSPGNSVSEIQGKVALYLEKGAVEVWVVDQVGKISFFNNIGAVKSSSLIKKVKL